MIELFAAKIVLILLAVVFAVLLFTIIKAVFKIALNAILGILGLLAFNYAFNAGIVINVWSVIITALGGIIGFIIVVALHYLKIAF